MALVGVELETLVSESDALTTRPPWLPSFKRAKMISTILEAILKFCTTKKLFLFVVYIIEQKRYHHAATSVTISAEYTG